VGNYRGYGFEQHFGVGCIHFERGVKHQVARRRLGWLDVCEHMELDGRETYRATHEGEIATRADEAYELTPDTNQHLIGAPQHTASAERQRGGYGGRERLLDVLADRPQIQLPLNKWIGG
jgi:hypothetical protein